MKLEDLSSPAKIKIFKLLVRVSTPLCFREIVYFSNVGVRSAQIALKDFKKEKIVKVKKLKNKTLYSLIESELSREFKRIFDAETGNKIVENSKVLPREAEGTISSIQEMYSFLHSIRK